MQWARKKFGFTVVELLVVIVVIAILASVTVVAYSGISSRADDTRTIAAVAEWAKRLVLYATDTGDYPYTGSKTQTPPLSSDPQVIARNYPCLGLYPDNICANITNTGVIGNGYAFVDTDFNQLIINKYGSTLPQPSQKDITINGQPHRGAFFSVVSYATGTAPTGTGPSIAFFISGKCPVTLAGYNVTQTTGSSGGTRCYLVLPSFKN